MILLIPQKIITLKELFNSINFRYILYIAYFLVIFVPVNILILLKYTLLFLNFQNFYVEFFTMTLISLYGIFIFSIRLTSPKIFNFFMNIILCNKKFIKGSEPLIENNNNILDNNMTEEIDFDQITYGNKNIPNKIEKKRTNSYELSNIIEIKTIKENEQVVEQNNNKSPESHRRSLQEKKIKDSTLKENKSINDKQLNINKISFANVFESFKQNKNDDKNIFNKNIIDENDSKYFSLISYKEEINNMLYRMIAISISINKNRIYDNYNKYQDYYSLPLPWKNTDPDFYKEQTPYENYTYKNIPNWINIHKEKNFEKIEFKVLSYSPFVFHHLRLIDKITIDDILESLDIKKNLQMVNDSQEILKRGDSSMIISWDKKLILKIINKNEKDNFINTMLEEYHSRMRDTKSILSHIYGVFKIQLGYKESYVILQRNMNYFFLQNNLLTFEINGLTIDRQSIMPEDIGLKKSILFEKYKNIILKDKDLQIINFKIELNYYDGKNILLSICNDSIFLEKLGVIDYSLLIFVNKYNKKNFEQNLGNSRVMHDVKKKYIFNFSIIDYLDIFSFEKKSEKFVNDFVGVFRVSIDKNFNLQDPQSYGEEFRKFAKEIIIYEKEDNDN